MAREDRPPGFGLAFLSMERKGCRRICGGYAPSGVFSGMPFPGFKVVQRCRCRCLFSPFEAGAVCRQALPVRQVQFHLECAGMLRAVASFGQIRGQGMKFRLGDLLQAGLEILVLARGFGQGPLILVQPCHQ